MCNETTKSSQTRLWAGVVSLHAPTSWGWGSIFAIFTSWVQHYFEFGGRGSSVERTALWKERLMYVIYTQIISMHYMYIIYLLKVNNGMDLAQQHSY